MSPQINFKRYFKLINNEITIYHNWWDTAKAIGKFIYMKRLNVLKSMKFKFVA